MLRANFNILYHTVSCDCQIIMFYYVTSYALLLHMIKSSLLSQFDNQGVRVTAEQVLSVPGYNDYVVTICYND